MSRENKFRKLSILFLIDELWFKGGTENHLFELAKGMSKKGHTVFVRTFWEGEFGRSFRAIESVDYDHINAKNIFSFKGIMAIFQISALIRKYNIEILQTYHTASDLCGPIIAIMANRGTTVISSRRDTGYTKTYRHIQVQKKLNRFVDKILANSSAVKLSVQDQEGVSSDKVEIIYNGLHMEPFMNVNEEKKRKFREMFHIPSGSILIGSVGNIRPIKGFETMVEVAGVLCRIYPKIHFLHAGADSPELNLGGLCNTLSIADRFSFLGKINNIPDFLSILDIYIQPSLSEGFSNAILEAMASGLPVIASNVGGNKEIIVSGENGFLAEPLDVTGFSDILSELIQNEKLRQDVGKKAQENVINNYAYEQMLDKYEAFYAFMRKRSVQ